MLERVKQIINNLKNDNENYKEYIKCFCELDKVKEENSDEYNDFMELIGKKNEDDDEL